MKRTLILAAVATVWAGQVQTRDYVSIVGFSTVYPFATVVAEQFGKTADFRTPKIESTGSGGGLKLFCAGVGVVLKGGMTDQGQRSVASHTGALASDHPVFRSLENAPDAMRDLGGGIHDAPNTPAVSA